MKTKLLRQLRLKFGIEKRNKEYRVQLAGNYTDSVCSNWVSLKVAKGIRRDAILKYARSRYKTAKQTFYTTVPK